MPRGTGDLDEPSGKKQDMCMQNRLINLSTHINGFVMATQIFKRLLFFEARFFVSAYIDSIYQNLGTCRI